MSGADTDVLPFTVRAAAGELLELHCDRVKVTPRGDLLGIVGRGCEVPDEERTRCVLAMPTGT